MTNRMANRIPTARPPQPRSHEHAHAPVPVPVPDPALRPRTTTNASYMPDTLDPLSISTERRRGRPERTDLMTSYFELTRTEDAPLPGQPAGPALPAGMPDRTPAERLERRDALTLTNQRLHAEIRRRMTDLTYHIWIRPLQLVDAADDRIYLAAPDHIRTWVDERYQGPLEIVASELAGRRLTAAIVPLEAIDPAAAA